MKFVVAFALFALAMTRPAASETQIVAMPGAPIEITAVSARYVEKGKYTREGIKFNASIKNGTDQRVTAYSVNFVTFDVFNESLGRPFSGYSMSGILAGETAKAIWEHNPLSAFRFGTDDAGTVAAYVSRARLMDGTIWKADPETVLSALQRIEQDLTLEDIEPEGG